MWTSLKSIVKNHIFCHIWDRFLLRSVLIMFQLCKFWKVCYSQNKILKGFGSWKFQTVFIITVLVWCKYQKNLRTVVKISNWHGIPQNCLKKPIWKQHKNMKSFNKRKLLISFAAFNSTVQYKPCKNQNCCAKISIYWLSNNHLITNFFQCRFQKQKEQKAHKSKRFCQTSLCSVIIS